jgi:hypothetical protein
MPLPKTVLKIVIQADIGNTNSNFVSALPVPINPIAMSWIHQINAGLSASLKARAYSAPCSGFTYLRLASFSPDILPFH